MGQMKDGLEEWYWKQENPLGSSYKNLGADDGGLDALDCISQYG